MSRILKDEFINLICGKPIFLEPLSRAYKCFQELASDTNSVVIVHRELAADMFSIIDNFDHNGDPKSIESSLALQMAQCVNKSLGMQAISSSTQWDQVARIGADSIQAWQQIHWFTLQCRGIGIYYGDHSRFDEIGESSSPMQVKNEQASALLPANWNVTYIDYKQAFVSGPSNQETHLHESSCIGWVIENTAIAYSMAGMRNRWEEILDTVITAGVTGDALCRELQRDHWSSVRFKADSMPAEDVGDLYEGVRIDNIIGDYRSASSKECLRKISKYPFFVGMFDRGNHTYVGTRGEVSEFHWRHMPTEKAIETTPLKERGGDGLLMLPPGMNI